MHEIITGDTRHVLYCGDNLEILKSMPSDSVDLVFTSPPYVNCRTYGIDFDLTGQEYVDWAKARFLECVRICKGMVCWVIEGKTEQYRYDCTPFLLMADLHRAGVHLRKPPVYHRVGIPGSGGPDWWRNDWEPIICGSNGGKLPWSDNTATGEPPKYGPGGVMSYRTTDGVRINQKRVKELVANGMSQREAAREVGLPFKVTTSGTNDGGVSVENTYVPPDLANPGNIIKCSVGGGKIGSELAHESEAPFPEELAEVFIRSFCPPNGIVLDNHCGSGTTLRVASVWGRNSIGIDIRQSQIDLSIRRLKEPLNKTMTKPVKAAEGQKSIFDE